VSLAAALDETCTHLVRTVTSGKVDTESWASAGTVVCRKLTRESHVINLEKTQSATRIRTRFMLPRTFTGCMRDRLQHEDRVYEIVEIIAARRIGSVSHLVAVCEAVA
jgi:hypothetical protein